ncbi:MAG: hypothetical protein WD426_05235 [Anditalea sp.]
MKTYCKKTLAATVLLILSFVVSNAQTDDIPRTSSYFDVALGVGDGIYSGALSWNRTHGIIRSNKLRLGYGVRFSSFGGSDLCYTTAPADLTAQEETIDTLHVASSAILNLNALINIQYQFSPRLLAGFDIDAFGFGFGPSKNTTFVTTPDPGTFNNNQTAQPTPFNLLLGFDNDIGQIKSEFYIKYQISDTWGIRGGMDMSFYEYTTEDKLANNNDRFRYKAMMPFAGVSFNPF